MVFDVRVHDRVYSLRDVSCEYEILLFDTSFIVSYMKEKKDLESSRGDVKRRVVNGEKKIDYFSELSESFKRRPNFFVTDKVLEEVLASETRSEERKLTFRRRGKKYTKEMVPQKTYSRLAREHDRLVSVLRAHGPVELNEEEKGEYHRVYPSFLNLKEAYNMSEANFDFLVTGMVLAKSRGTVALMSNDVRGIGTSWHVVLRTECFNDDGLLGFFIHEELGEFRKSRHL
jgi:hypothetical protein